MLSAITLECCEIGWKERHALEHKHFMSVIITYASFLGSRMIVHIYMYTCCYDICHMNLQKIDRSVDDVC